MQYFFYKNVAAFTPQLLMAIFNNFSTQSIYDSVNMTLFNIVFTSIPIFCYGMLEQNISASTLMNYPKLYKNNAKNRLLAIDKCFLWNFEGLWHCLVIFFGFYFYWDSFYNLGNPQHTLEMFSYGLAVYHTVVILVNLKLLFYANHWNGFIIGSVIFSTLIFYAFT